MKKIFFILLLLSCFAGAFAETGYNGIKWFTEREVFKKSTGYKTTQSEVIPAIEMQEKTMLGEKTTVNYFFSAYDCFEGVIYTIPEKKTSELKDKLNKPIKTFKTDTFTREQFSREILKEEPDFKGQTQQTINTYFNYVFYSICFYTFEQESNYEIIKAKKNSKGTLYIYDYNDDTRLYIFENIIEGLTFVVYLNHGQDF